MTPEIIRIGGYTGAGVMLLFGIGFEILRRYQLKNWIVEEVKLGPYEDGLYLVECQDGVTRSFDLDSDATGACQGKIVEVHYASDSDTAVEFDRTIIRFLPPLFFLALSAVFLAFAWKFGN